MNGTRIFRQSMGAMLIFLLLVGCGAPAAEPIPAPSTATDTPIPPTTATSTTEPPTSTPTPAFTLATSIEDVVGTWYNPNKNIYLRFYEDGTFHHAHGLDDEPHAINEFQFEGEEMFIKTISVSGVPSCGDEIGTYKVRLYPNGTIQIAKIKDNCLPRLGETALKFDPVP